MLLPLIVPDRVRELWGVLSVKMVDVTLRSVRSSKASNRGKNRDCGTGLREGCDCCALWKHFQFIRSLSKKIPRTNKSKGLDPFETNSCASFRESRHPRARRDGPAAIQCWH